MKRPGERAADTAAPFWAKTEHMVARKKAHFWIGADGAVFLKSGCGMLYSKSSLIVADEHTTRCNTCEKKASA